MSIDDDYDDDDYYESSDYDIIHFDEEYEEEAETGPIYSSQVKKKLKKQKRLEDWLEEKRSQNELTDKNLDLP